MIFLANNSEKENVTDKLFINHRVSLRSRKHLRRTSEKFVPVSEILSSHMKKFWLPMTLLAILLMLSELRMKLASFRYGKKDGLQKVKLQLQKMELRPSFWCAWKHISFLWLLSQQLLQDCSLAAGEVDLDEHEAAPLYIGRTVL